MFQKLPFFSSSRSWSDSEVPLIESEIKFLQILLGEISGVDYLEHRLYLKEQINYKKQYKQEILKREYLQNFAYNQETMSSCRKKFPYIDVMNLQIRMAYNKKIETENPFLKGDAKK